MKKNVLTLCLVSLFISGCASTHKPETPQPSLQNDSKLFESESWQPVNNKRIDHKKIVE